MKSTEKCWLDGQITVFASLIFMMVVSVLLSQYKSALFYACYSDANQAAQLSVDAFLATYQRPLRDRYGILAVDAGYGSKTFAEEKIENLLLEVFNRNIQSSLDVGAIQSIRLVDMPVYTMLCDSEWEWLLREMTLNRQEVLVDQGIEWIIEQWTATNNQAENELIEKKRIAQETENTMDESTKEESDTQVLSEQDPRDNLMNIWNQGILKAACPAGYLISEKTIQLLDVSFPENVKSMDAHINFQDESSVLRMFDQWENILNPEMFVKDLSEKTVLQSYIQTYFQNFSKTSEKEESNMHALDYEVEYLIGGKESDRENLRVILWKLLALRCVFNLSYLMSSPEKSQQVYATAAALSTALWIPQFTEVTAFVLKIAWAFAESLADCRTLLSGGKIPMLKDDTSWYLTWNQMMSLNSEVLDLNKSQQGWDYNQYLQILLTFTETDTLYRRMTHLMEKNIRLMPQYEGFWMKNCIYGVLVNYECEFDTFGNYIIQTALSY